MFGFRKEPDETINYLRAKEINDKILEKFKIELLPDGPVNMSISYNNIHIAFPLFTYMEVLFNKIEKLERKIQELEDW